MNDSVSQAIQGVPLNYYIWLSTALFAIGVLGVMYRRNDGDSGRLHGREK